MWKRFFILYLLSSALLQAGYSEVVWTEEQMFSMETYVSQVSEIVKNQAEQLTDLKKQLKGQNEQIMRQHKQLKRCKNCCIALGATTITLGVTTYLLARSR